MPRERHPTSEHKMVVPCVVGRYLMCEEIASGGMASVHFGRLSSDAGFSRTVAIKCLHPNYARDSQFISMLLDEARLVSRIRHPNVAVPLDVVVVAQTQEVFLVMEYIHGETFAWLIEQSQRHQLPAPPNVIASILIGVLHGLHAAHEAVDESGKPLNIVHRDISPQNIMVGADGIARVLDFGIAKAVTRSQSTHEGQIKGKVSYMAPEQLTGRAVDRRADLFAAGVVLWEALTLRRLFRSDDLVGAASKVLHDTIPRPSSINGNVSQAFDRLVLKALNRNPAVRFQTATDFAAAIEEEVLVASSRKVSNWVTAVAAQSLARRAEQLARIESEYTDPCAFEGIEAAHHPLRTASQSVPVLSEAELRRHLQARTTPPPEVPSPAPVRSEVEATPPPEVPSPAPVRSEVEATPPARSLQPQASSLPGPGINPPPAQSEWTLTALINTWTRKKMLLVGGIVGLGAALAILGVELHFNLRSVDAQQFSGPQEIRPASPPPATQQAASSSPVLPIGPSMKLEPAGLKPANSKASAARSLPPKLKASVARPAAPVEARGEARNDCDPPYLIDRDGIRRIKAQCL